MKIVADKDLRKNGEGYMDMTAYRAIINVSKEDDNHFHKLLDTIFNICELSGFEIQGRIVLKDKKLVRFGGDNGLTNHKN